MAASLSDDERLFLAALGERMISLRKAAGLTQAQMAELLEVSQQAVQSWEAGRRRIQICILPAVAKVLAVSLDELLGEEAETTPRKRGPAPKWQQQIEAIERLPKSQQKLITQTLNALLAQAGTQGD